MSKIKIKKTKKEDGRRKKEEELNSTKPVSYRIAAAVIGTFSAVQFQDLNDSDVGPTAGNPKRFAVS